MRSPLLVCLAASLSAHDLYLIPSTFLPAAGATFAIGFHVGDSFPNSEVGGRLNKLVEPDLRWQGGRAAMANLHVEATRDAGDAVAGGAGHLIAGVRTAPTFIELAPAKFTSYLEAEGLTSAVAFRAQHGETARPGKERYSKFAKAILLSGQPNGYFAEPLGYAIEIVPEQDPYTVKPGGMLPVRVLFRGQPAADLQIESARVGKRSAVGRTGPDGRLAVPIDAAGKWRIHTIKMERCAEPAVADWESSWASLTFEVR